MPFLLFPRTNHSYLRIFLRRTRIYFYFKLISNKIFFNLLKASVQNFELRKIETFFIRGINVLTNVFLRILIVPKEKRKKSNKNLFISKINNRRVTPLPLFQIIYIESYWTTKCKCTRERGGGALFKNAIGHRLIFVIAFSSLTIDRSWKKQTNETRAESGPVENAYTRANKLRL